MAMPCMMEDDGGLARRPSAAMSSELSRQDADERLAHDLAERLRGTWHGSGYAGYVTVEPTTSAHVIARACKLFYGWFRDEHVLPHIVPDPLVNTLLISFRAN